MPREMRVVPVMCHLEPSLHEHLIRILNDESESGSSFMRGLLVKELIRRGLLDDDTRNRLVGAAR